MSSIRRHVITGDPILFAPERARRPNAFAAEEDVSLCPFCPGHESDTPPEISRRGDPWRVRVFPNKYPAVPGHEVIVETSSHGEDFAGIGDPAEVIAVYQERYEAHRNDSAHVALFKNHGPSAGASLGHPHSQLMPLSFVPPVIERHVTAFARSPSCPLCAAIESHQREGLLISENERYVRFTPRSPSHAWEQWIAPRRHHPELSLRSDEQDDLGSMLQLATAAAARIRPSYNILWFSFKGQKAAHFYASVFPRMTAIAGLELGTGTFIDIIDPADAAGDLR